MDRLAALHAAWDGPVPPAELEAERASRPFDAVDHARRSLAVAEARMSEHKASARKCRARGDTITAGVYWRMVETDLANIKAFAEIIKRNEQHKARA